MTRNGHVVIPLDLSSAEGMADRAPCIRTKLEVAHFRLAIFGSFKKVSYSACSLPARSSPSV